MHSGALLLYAAFLSGAILRRRDIPRADAKKPRTRQGPAGRAAAGGDGKPAESGEVRQKEAGSVKFIHLSDLHLGKRVNGFSMLEDQRDILQKLLKLTEAEQPDGVLIAGDVYDRPTPPAEAVELFDAFLVRLAGLCRGVFVISGNHDSPERLAFGGRLMTPAGVHLAPVYSGQVEPVEMQDEYGPLRVYLLPFLRPAAARRLFEEDTIETATDAMRAAVARMQIDPSLRNLLVTHQFVVGSARAESEELFAGGAEGVDGAVFAPFDYVALGHLHRPQGCGGNMRYSGTPLAYSFSEAGETKSAAIVQLGAKGEVSVRCAPLTPLHPMREVRGRYEQLTARPYYQGTGLPGAYLHITLTDEEDQPDAVGRLRSIYPLLMRLDYDNARTRAAGEMPGPEASPAQSPMELFAQLYEAQNGRPMSAGQAGYLQGLVREIWQG